MLFDLRGRGRRRTIQVIYLGLAVLMGGGLVLFGVGAGNGTGGLLNAFNPSGGGSAAKQYVSQQTKNAAKQTQLHPNDAQDWATLAQDRYYDASPYYNTTTQTYTATGKASLTAAGQAWKRYIQLDKHPSSDLGRLMAQAYAGLGDYTQEAQAWEFVAQANPKVSSYWADLAASAYQAKDTDLGDLAAAKALALTPKAERATLKTELQQAKAQTSTTATTTT
jgi:predicted Zn-dependent protease